MKGLVGKRYVSGRTMAGMFSKNTADSGKAVFGDRRNPSGWFCFFHWMPEYWWMEKGGPVRPCSFFRYSLPLPFRRKSSRSLCRSGTGDAGLADCTRRSGRKKAVSWFCKKGRRALPFLLSETIRNNPEAVDWLFRFFMYMILYELKNQAVTIEKIFWKSVNHLKIWCVNGRNPIGLVVPNITFEELWKWKN